MSFDPSLNQQNANEIPSFDFLKPAECKVGIVMSKFNREICVAALGSCVEKLERMGVRRSNIVLHTVPGALEIPVVMQAMATNLQLDAMVAIGCVIRGETYHFELVSDMSARGIMEVSLEHCIPIANGIITVENMDQAIARKDIKGAEAATAALCALDEIMASEHGKMTQSGGLDAFLNQ